ncbi:MAG TPA: hypothetical protein VH327_04375 [Gammaproteobacteria bacterium]|jgi:hypothetical protein|nr:hypothetical protein [Gammaproteobacteria bacterium]
MKDAHAMSNQDESAGRRTHGMKGWMLHMTHVASSGNTEARNPGKRRFGLDDRRLATRPEPSDRRLLERRDA